MDWVLDHLQVLILVAAAAFAILQKIKGVRAPGASTPPAAEDPEQAERTRRIQEEIRRRIMERRGQPPGLPTETESAAAEPLPFPAAPPMIEEVRPVAVPPPLAPAVVVLSADQREMERQRVLLQQLREWEAVAPVHPGGEPAPVAGTGAGVHAAGKPGWLRAEMRHPAALRRAIILREILGPPVGLQ